MGYASKVGRARVSAKSPSALAVCDRCGIWTNHNRLRWQFDWAGASLINKRILVCDTCEDVPQNQLRAIVLPADPTPIQNPRTQDYVAAETNTRYTSGQNTVDPITGLPIPGGNVRVTQNNDDRVMQQTGEPPGGRNQLPGTDWAVPAVIYNGTEIGLPYNTGTVPFTGPLSPPYNYVGQWNNQWQFGMRTGSYWSNTTSAFVTWTSNIL